MKDCSETVLKDSQILDSDSLRSSQCFSFAPWQEESDVVTLSASLRGRTVHDCTLRHRSGPKCQVLSKAF